MQKAYFSWLMQVCVGLTMLATCFNPGFLASHWSAGFGRFQQVSALSSHWLADCANFTPTRGKTTNTVPTTLSTIQATSQSTFINEQTTNVLYL
jgi:hypothetical protein